ncbi:hypothetical protein JGU71_19255 [Antrihabitans sp. YC3-6]|uniref:Uncharacterized protein n=1 Tax=Antrihabitans stalagmiti TaxID=2799499 RepID=A0A934NTI5_9NOCA|nr:hypothetical protein [Antrihabitans stalagmiti]MBJ8341029.1 hypothetical protein [Antrihabitans stalagmiti]
MSFSFTICKFGPEETVVKLSSDVVTALIGDYSLEPTDTPDSYIFHDGNETSEVDVLRGGMSLDFPRPLASDRMTQLLFDALSRTGATLFSSSFEGVLTTNPAQSEYVPGSLQPTTVIERWQDIDAYLAEQ